MYDTKLVVEIECKTQFGPSSARSMVQNLLNVPAITKATLVTIDSDYKPLTPGDFEAKVMKEFPLVLKGVVVE